MFLLIQFGAEAVHAQEGDISDAFWSIIVPVVEYPDLNMGRVQVHDVRDSVITGYLQNNSSAEIRIDSIFVVGNDASAFIIQPDSSPFIIPAGENHAVTFRFSPESAGVKEASVLVYSISDTLSRRIYGVGVSPQVELVNEIIDFGDIYVGAVSDSLAVPVLRNTGIGAVTVSSPVKIGPDSGQFNVLAPVDTRNLSPNETFFVDVRFIPVVQRQYTCRIELNVGGIDLPTVITLVGTGVSADATMAIAIDTIHARVGEVVQIPITIKAQHNLSYSAARSINTELRYNASLLSPIGTTPTGILEGKQRIIPLEGLPLNPDVDTILGIYRFMATLGDEEGTVLQLTNSTPDFGSVAISEIAGYFSLLDICREGGTRLVDGRRKLSLQQNHPNPFNAVTTIEYEVIESGYTRLSVHDLLGRTTAILVEGVAEVGRYSVVFDASSLSSGTYLYVLQTPTARIHKRMDVIK